MGLPENTQGANADSSESTDAPLMLNNEARKLIKALLQMALISEKVKSFLIARLGKRSIQTGERVLETLGGLQEVCALQLSCH